MARTICGHWLRTYFAFMLLSTKRKGITCAVVIGIFLKYCNVLNCDTRLELLTSQRVASMDSDVFGICKLLIHTMQCPSVKFCFVLVTTLIKITTK